MNIYQFMSNSPFLTFVLALILCAMFGGILNLIFKLWNRLMRHMNIRAHGWPPSNCDADGDFKDVK